MQEPSPSSSAERPKGKARESFALTLAILGLLLLLPNIYIMHLRLNYKIPEDDADMLQGLFSVAGSILGIFAWILTKRDLKTSSHAALRLGETLAILSTFANPGFIAFTGALVMFTSAKLAPGKDSMINDLGNQFALAYQYRIRPLSMKGGGKVYTGYQIPGRFSKNENGYYAATVLHPDTVQFLAKWLDDSTATISVKIGPDGRPIAQSWIYTGSFKD